MHQVLPPNPPVGKWEKTAEKKNHKTFFHTHRWWKTSNWYLSFDTNQINWHMLAFNIIPVFPSPSFFVWSPLVQPVFLLLSIGLSSAHPVAHSLYFFLEDLSIFQWCELDDAKKHIRFISSYLSCCSLISLKLFLSKNWWCLSCMIHSC